jgi:nicotinate-nucleotide pyrophosphorylase (carboxylating)
MKISTAVLPPFLILDQLLQSWLIEDIGRGDRTTQSLLFQNTTEGQAKWVAKASGVIAGLPVAARVFQLLNQKVSFVAVAAEGQQCEPGEVIAEMQGSLDTLLMGERVALNLAMRLSGIATLTRKYTAEIADLPAQLG